MATYGPQPDGEMRDTTACTCLRPTVRSSGKSISLKPVPTCVSEATRKTGCSWLLASLYTRSTLRLRELKCLEPTFSPKIVSLLRVSCLQVTDDEPVGEHPCKKNDRGKLK